MSNSGIFHENPPYLIFSHIFFENSLQFQKLYLPLQPQTRKIGAIAQLVEQRTEKSLCPRFDSWWHHQRKYINAFHT